MEPQCWQIRKIYHGENRKIANTIEEKSGRNDSLGEEKERNRKEAKNNKNKDSQQIEIISMISIAFAIYMQYFKDY